MRWTVGQRLVLSFFFMAILMAAAGAFSVYNLSQLNVSTEEILREHQPILTDMAAIESSVLFHSLKVDQYVTTGNRAHLRAVEELRNDVETHLADLEDRTYGAEDQQFVQEIREAYDIYVSLSDELRAFYHRNPDDTAGVEGRQMRIAALLENALLAKADVLYETKQSEAQELIQANSKRYLAYVRTAIVSSLVLTLLAIALGVLISRSIIVPVGQLVKATQRIAGGDLTARAQVRTGDEIGLLANVFNSMAAQLGELIETLEQRVAERTRDLRASEERFRDIAENTADWIWEVDAAGRYTYCSESIVDVLGYTPKEVLGKTPFQFMPPDEAARVGEIFAEIAANRRLIVDLENRRLTKDGDEVMLLTNGVSILDSEGNLLGYRGVDKDITERKRAEEQIKASLQEKEVLLKEIHHRVKNNLQVISSLLHLQSNKIENQEALKVFQESQNRIRSMALVHERLYQSKDLARVDFAGYVQNLASYLFRSYGVNSSVIQLKADADDVFLGIDTAIPCGLILNELVSNSLKHAFPGGKEGEIRIELCSDDDGQFTLAVSDNGVGLPKGLDFRDTESLGLQLVNTLVDQLEGAIEMDRSSGTTFEITFTELE